MRKIGAWAILGLLAAAACNDDDDNTTAKLSSREQADMVASSLGHSGFAGSAEQSAEYAGSATAGRVQECGYTNEGNFDLGATLGQIVFSLNYDYYVELNCDGNDEPESFTANFDYAGSYTSPRFESDYSGSGDLTFTALDDEYDSFTLNGSYDRSGSFKTKENGEVSEEGEHNIDIDVKNVMISKGNKKITSGSATVDADGDIDGRGSYSFRAQVTFNNNGTATIKVAGDTYTLTFSNNTVVKVDD